MRLATLKRDGGSRAAVITADGAAPVEGYADVGELLAAGEAGWDAARTALSAGEARAFSERDLLRPVLHPGAVVCVGLNYRTHILEMGRELPTVPTLFAKLERALTDPFADVELPRPSEQVDYEGELAVIIGTGGRDIPEAEALSHVAGVTVLNDVTARDYQRRTIQWFAGKTFQRSTPIGPWIVTLEEFGTIGPQELSLKVNGEERQRAPLSELVIDVPGLVADISRIAELQAGDVIATGTPGGVGEPQGKFLRAGDVVEVAIDGIGALRNTFVGSTRQ
jgi:acylpyruvate hydrolase